MQTGIFYVRLKEDIDTNEQGNVLEGRVAYLHESFKKGVPYPVLAVEYRESNKIKTTFYHMPTESKELGWFASDFFLFGKD